MYHYGNTQYKSDPASFYAGEGGAGKESSAFKRVTGGSGKTEGEFVYGEIVKPIEMVDMAEGPQFVVTYVYLESLESSRKGWIVADHLRTFWEIYE